eukprot:TRINITY_DN4870_c0_g1_i2.p1 TRINITY_DN4870_c0_g1~~TRINITY_DN4870_c0_g1_i2.p1  ORF type:complete len:254 (+),score=24.46 TRINITY_DN4870_c0_g1_i2:435-1196(+)
MISSLLICAYSIWRAVEPYPNDAMDWVLLATSIVFQTLALAYAYPLYQEYRWRLYRKIGANTELESVYSNVMFLRAFLLLDLMFNTIVSLCSGLGLFNTGFRLALEIVNLIVGFLFIFSGWKAFNKEYRFLVVLFFCFCWVSPAFIIYNFIVIGINGSTTSPVYETKALSILFVSTGAAQLVIRILLMFLAILVVQHFGEIDNLANVRQIQEEIDDENVQFDFGSLGNDDSVTSVIQNTYAQGGFKDDVYVKA